MRMKTRLSLTVDPQVTHRAKRVARHRKQSLSAMVEDLLREAADSGGRGRARSVSRPFSERWAGRLKLESKDEPRFKHLAKKYRL